MYKPLADSTLQRMKKTEIIELLRIAEHNAKVAQEYVDQQAENIKDWTPVRHGRWISVPHKLARVCSVCNRDEPYKFADINIDVYDYCPNCGAKMDGGCW